ncbi:unnamed protein product [Caenorhabditis bovis]|uniref:ubiquitinyl hydrolase 1 n=1 Tax=Caenorhabditis bovis TaxID=2654633 RepID=A0A8S1EZN7_9PELO|nr:unnamed protein product [Caenorhabditis bovis]
MISDSFSTDLSSLLKTSAFVEPSGTTKIFKDECLYCYNNPQSHDGLFISFADYHSVCRKHLSSYVEKTNNKLFLQLETKKIAREQNSHTGEPSNKISKLTIQDEPFFDFDDAYHIIIYPDLETRQSVCDELDEKVRAVAKHIASCTSAERLTTLSSSNNAWDADIKLITKHANLEQLPNGKKLEHSGWMCEEEGCGLTENLWLCLTDGAVRCGRSQFISEGQKSAGNGHMKEYCQRTGYPLVVKLGTICAQLDAADVYSYDEDDAVIDPNLDKHLAHFGLDCTKMQKTAKSTMELELDMNEKWEYQKCQEDGVSLTPIYGPGYTGLINTGSSCYMNSVHTDFNCQMAKVFSSMMSGDYSQEDENSQRGIKPLQFKRVAAGNHPEFSTAKQQDVEEYIRFLIERISNMNPEDVEDPTNKLRFEMWNRFEDLASHNVRYTHNEELILRLQIPQNILEVLANKTEFSAESRVSIDMKMSLGAAFGAQFVEGYKSPITGEAKGATNKIQFKSFPDYLFVQVQKFAYSSNGQMKKLDIDFDVLEELDLTAYRGSGKAADEECLPEDVPTEAAFVMPENLKAVAEQLMAMGFGKDACYRASFEANGNLETASNWLMEHLDDPHLNDEFTGPKKGAAVNEADEATVAMIVELGFTSHQAKFALNRHPDPTQAIDWLFNHIEDVPPEVVEGPKNVEKKNGRVYVDGPGNYKLIGMISHMGSRPDSGHYVAHILKDDKWVLFNDEKVALSQDPPKKLAYIYIYKRV